MADPISDLLTRIRNAGLSRLERCEVPASSMKTAIVKILKEEGYVEDFRVGGDEPRRVITVFLRYGKDRVHCIEGIQRISKPGKRRYVAAREVPKVRRGMGVAVLSTSLGVLSDREARKRNVGGEVLFEVW